MTSISQTLINMNAATSKMDAATSQSRMGSSDVTKHDFLRLLTEQLKNQDPLKPMENMEFLTQQAMFSQVEELQNLSSALQQSSSIQQASGMIGKSVTVVDPDNSKNTITGVVKSANITSDGASIEINSVNYPLNLVTKIENVSQ